MTQRGDKMARNNSDEITILLVDDDELDGEDGDDDEDGDGGDDDF